MAKITIKVKTCWSCKFCNEDAEIGPNRCNLDKTIIMSDWNHLPKYSVHEKCPLKFNDYSFGL